MNSHKEELRVTVFNLFSAVFEQYTKRVCVFIQTEPFIKRSRDRGYPKVKLIA